MKLKLFVLFLLLSYTTSLKAQNPADKILSGKWINTGFEYNGSFYPSNLWNSDTLTFFENFTFEKNGSDMKSLVSVSFRKNGKWSLSNQNSHLSFYSDDQRYSSHGKIMIFDTDFKIDFLNENYLAVRTEKYGKEVVVRYQKEGTRISYEENLKQYNDALINPPIAYDPSSFYIVNVLRPERKQLKYFKQSAFDVKYTLYYPTEQTQKRVYNFSGKILDFKDSSVTFSIDNEIIQERFTNANKTTVVQHYPTAITREIPISNLKSLYNTCIRSAYRASLATAVVSSVAMLVVAPLASIRYKSGGFNEKTYFTVAGIGLIGMGISIPAAYFFRSQSIHLNKSPQTKKSVFLSKIEILK